MGSGSSTQGGGEKFRFEGGNLGCPRKFAGISWTPGGVQNVLQKRLCSCFSPYQNPVADSSKTLNREILHL